MEHKRKKNRFRQNIKRVIALSLAILLVGQMQTGSLLITGIQSVLDMVKVADARSRDTYDYAEMYNQHHYYHQITGDRILDDNFEIYRSGKNILFGNSCYTDTYFKCDAIEARQDEFIAEIKQLNESFEAYGDAGGGIEYKTGATKAGEYGNINFFTKENGTASSSGYIDDSTIPAKLTMKNYENHIWATYTKKIDITGRVARGQNLNYQFAMNVLDKTGSYVEVTLSNGDTILGQTSKWSNGRVSISSAINSDKLKAEGGKYYITAVIKVYNGSATLGNLRFQMSGSQKTKFVNMYMTSKPIPAGIKDNYAAVEGYNPDDTADYTAEDDMYIVMQFTDSVYLKKKCYYDRDFDNTQSGKVCYMAYPRLSLTVTDHNGVEQNRNVSIYADYFGVMDGLDASGNMVENNSLIFKVDIGGWENKDFCIAGLARADSGMLRSGNMNWIYNKRPDNLDETINLIKGCYPSWKQKSNEDYFKGAIMDTKGNEISVTERAGLNTITVKNRKGEDEEALPVFHGSIPSIREVVITAQNGNEMVKPGDNVNVKVVFSGLLDESLPTPTFYLNDFSPDTTAMPGDADWDGTIVSDGVYGDTRMVPLIAHWKVKENDANNVWSTESATEIPDNHTGAATLEIQGTDGIEGGQVYYRIVDDMGIAMQKGDEFDTKGWSLYTEPVYLTGLPTVIQSMDKNGDMASLIRIADGGFVEVCEAVPHVTYDEEGNVKEETLLVHKFGTSDEIDTSEDSEEAMVQENTPPATVISYTVPVKGNVDVTNLMLLHDMESYNYSYYNTGDGGDWRWTSYRHYRLRMDGEARNIYGKAVPVENYGTYDQDGKLIRNGQQYSYVGLEKEVPAIGRVEVNTKSANKVSDKITISDYRTILELLCYHERGIYLKKQTGLEHYTVEIGPVNSDMMVSVDGDAEVELPAGEIFKTSRYISEKDKDLKQFHVTAELLPDEYGNYNKVEIPVSVKAYDKAGNVGTRNYTREMGLDYAEFELWSHVNEPVTMEHTNEAWMEEEGLLVVSTDIEEKSGGFKAEYFKMAVLPQGEKPDADTIWYDINSADKLVIEDDNGQAMTSRLWSSGEHIVLWIDMPNRGYKINKSVYVTYKTPEGNNYACTAYDEEGRPYLCNYKTIDISYDTTGVAPAIDLNKTTTYQVTTVDKSDDPTEGVSIELSDGQLINGKLKRKNYYQFDIKTDEYTKVEYIIRSKWNNFKTVRGTVEPNTTTTLDTRDLGVKFGADTPFDGSAWLQTFEIDFIPITMETHTITEYTHYYSAEGELLRTESREVKKFEKEGAILNSNLKYYKFNVLDELFVRRSEEYHEFYNDDYSSRSNRIFLEMDLDYNSLNGYSDYINYPGVKREMAYTGTLFDKTTMVFGDDVSEYLQPETDIDFANSYIYIYPVKPAKGSGAADYVKDGDYVRKIPLPANIHEVTYNMNPPGYAPSMATALGFEADLNAYVTEIMLDEEGNETEHYGMPKEGTYGAFVEIATYLQDENGKPVVINSNHYMPTYDSEGNETIKQIEIPDVVFTYDYTAPEGGLYFTEEVIDYIKETEDIEECRTSREDYNGEEIITYDLTSEKETGETYYSDEKLMKEVNSEESVIVKPGENISLYLANPGLETGGFRYEEGNTTYDYSYYAEGGDMFNYNENCEISYAYVPIESFDVYGNLDAEAAESVEWKHKMDEYNRSYEKMMELTVPEDMTESCYLLVKFKDSTGNESAIYKKRVVPDIEAPTATMYQYTNEEGSYVQLIQITDDYSKAGEIYVTNDNGIEHPYGTKAAESFKAQINNDEEYSITICDKAGNENTIFLSENGIKMVAPTVTNLTEDTGVKDSMIASGQEADMVAARETVMTSEDTQELVYDTETEKGNGYVSFSVLPGTGEDIYVDYAWSSDSYKKLKGIDSEEEYGYMWTDALTGDTPEAAGMVNAVVSEKPDVSGAYTVNASILLPKSEEAATYALTFRFRNGAGLSSYYTVGYKVGAAGDITVTPVLEEKPGNRQGVVFSEPVKIISPVYNSNAKHYKAYADLYCDANGKYELLVQNLTGEEYTLSLEYDGKADNVPDIHKTSDEDGIYLELDMGYTRGYAMTFDTLEGEHYMITPSEEEGRVVTCGDTKAYQYAMVMVTDNTEFTINLLSEDGLVKDTYTYVVDSFIDTADDYYVEYSRDASGTTSENAASPVEAELIMPEGAEVLSTDGNLHTFYKNGTYTFEVKTPEGEIKKIEARVDWITEAEADYSDDIKPMYSLAKYIRNEGELVNITEDNASDVMTNATVQVKVWPLDIHPETGELNPVTMTIKSENGVVTQSEEDEYLLTFTDNDTATVTLEDPSGNKTTFDVTVDNINKEIPVTGKIRYVRYGITEVRAYISLPEGINLRSLEGIQMEERGDGKVEYYHLFTQNGTFTFPLEGANGSRADLTTKYVEVIREPLFLTVSSVTPETPDWGDSQVMSISSNLKLSDVYLTDMDGALIDDMEVTRGDKKLVVKFTDNRTVICYGTAENGSRAEITLSTDKIRLDTSNPVITYTVDGGENSNTRQVNLSVKDIVKTDYVNEDTNITLHVEGDVAEMKEDTPVLADNNGLTTVTKTAHFTVTKPGTYEVFAYDMAGNVSSKTIDIQLDNVKPVLENLTETFTETTRSCNLKFTISNEAGTIHCAGETYTVAQAGDEIIIPAKKNGTYMITAEDKAGNQSKMEVTVNHLDTEAPVITAESDGKYTFSYKDYDSEEALIEAIRDKITVTDNSGKEVDISLDFTMDVRFDKKGRYVAIVTATDVYGNTTSLPVQVTIVYNEVIEHKELDTFGVNGEVLVKNGVITTNDVSLNFVNIPEGATLTYAQGKNTGAQMKYRGTLLEGNTLTVTEKGMYTFMVKLTDYTVHVYYVAVN